MSGPEMVEVGQTWLLSPGGVQGTIQSVDLGQGSASVLTQGGNLLHMSLYPLADMRFGLPISVEWSFVEHGAVAWGSTATAEQVASIKSIVRAVYPTINPLGCERCKDPATVASDRRPFCARCGVWL